MLDSLYMPLFANSVVMFEDVGTTVFRLSRLVISTVIDVGDIFSGRGWSGRLWLWMGKVTRRGVRTERRVLTEVGIHLQLKNRDV